MEIINKKITLKKFRFSLFKVFLFATPTTLFVSHFFNIVNGLFFQEERIINYSSLLPFSLGGEKSWFLSKEYFIVFCLFSVFFYSLFSYLCESQAERLIVKVSSYLKNCLLRKFRHLKFEERLKKKEEVNSLVEIESNLVAEHWVNLWKEMYKGFLSILILFYTFFKNRDTQKEISKEAFFFTAFWLVFINGFVYFLNKANFAYGRLSKEITTKEYGLINKEINNSILIDSTGYNVFYEDVQQNLTRKAASKRVLYRNIAWLGKIIPWHLLINFFPFFLLIFDKNFIGVNLAIIWNTLNNLVWAFGYLWNYPDYSSSLSRINSFLILPEKNDNLTGISIKKTLKIKSITFENVSFRYRGQSEWILKNYNRTFSWGEVNYLTGANGAGKSTILYLLLGMLVPQQGQVIVETESGITYNLHQELNLQTWREQNVAYCTYENLIESGSTGQKQWASLQSILNTKSTSPLFLFDEADNALDSEKQQEFQKEIEKLVKQKKLVINAKCWEN